MKRRPIENSELIEGTNPIEGTESIEDPEPIEGTDQMEITDPIDDTDSTDGTDLTGENQQENAETSEMLELQEPVDLTESVSITLSEFWYMDSSGNKYSFIQNTITQDTISGDKHTIVVMSLPDETDVFELGDAKGKLSFELSNAKASDYFSFSMPACFVDLECKAVEENGYAISCQKQTDESWQITVTLENEAPGTGEISLTWSLIDALKVNEEQCVDFCFTRITEDFYSYRLILPALKRNDEFDVSYLEDDPEQQTTEIVRGDFPIYGMIEFDEKIAGKNWAAVMSWSMFK